MQNQQFSIQIPGYKILNEIGHGGMATVYLAQQESLERLVALKVMNPSFSADESFSKRFQTEGKTVAKLTHNNIITIHDIGINESNHYISMEFIEDGDLKNKIKQEQISNKQIFSIIRQIASALGHAHKNGFIHRDIKPENILFKDEETVVLTDFGIAKSIAGPSKLTATGTSIGTLYYMSPEQARASELDGRSDLYSLGVVLFEMLAGKVPYDSGDTLAIAYSHVNDPIPRLPDNQLGLQPLLNKVLAKNPANRFQTAEEFISALNKIENNEDVPELTRVTDPSISKQLNNQNKPALISKNNNRYIISLCGVITILIACYIVISVYISNDDSSNIKTTNTQTSTASTNTLHDEEQPTNTSQKISTLIFNDSQLDKCVKNTAKRNLWENVEQFTSLQCDNSDIINASDINQLTSLFTLDLSNNHINEIDISTCKDLRFLNMKNNKIRGIDIKNIPYLTYIDLSNNRLDTIDVSQNKMLASLVINDNTISRLDLSNNLALELLNANRNSLKDINLANQEIISRVLLSKNWFQDIDLINNRKIQYLNLEGNKISAIKLPIFINLEYLNLENNHFSLHACEYLINNSNISKFTDDICNKAVR